MQYEPRDLTISVAAGLSWRELTHLLAGNRQMVPIDPPYDNDATVGGVIAANSSGPRRRLYGTARDLVIGLQFVTLEGKLVQSGGMVVKNVAGLDMAKLMIGSFGTLAAIATVNFKLQPMPEVERSFLLPFASLPDAIACRNRILKGSLQPSAIDLLNPAAGATLGNSAWLLALRAGGNAAAIDRYEREFAALADGLAFEDDRQVTLWHHIANFTPAFLARHDDGAVVRASCTLKETEAIMRSFPGPAIARAGNGVCYGYFERSRCAAEWMSGTVGSSTRAVVEFAPDRFRKHMDLWPSVGGDFEIMQRVKQLFDPNHLLNRGRLYRRI
jgi:glycolate oxidase FAD binding subunit